MHELINSQILRHREYLHAYLHLEQPRLLSTHLAKPPLNSVATDLVAHPQP